MKNKNIITGTILTILVFQMTSNVQAIMLLRLKTSIIILGINIEPKPPIPSFKAIFQGDGRRQTPHSQNNLLVTVFCTNLIQSKSPTFTNHMGLSEK